MAKSLVNPFRCKFGMLLGDEALPCGPITLPRGYLPYHVTLAT